MIHTIPAAERHSADHGWLKPTWLFSFADYYDEDNLQFGTLRVFNDDVIAAGTGFGMHGHRDMEIVTVVLDGAVTHQDSMGNKTTIKAGEVQRMSAGTGVMHSEHNRGTGPLHLYQVWFPPRKTGMKPDYEQRDYSAVPRINRLLPVVSGFGHPEAMTINSDAAMSLADLEPGQEHHRAARARSRPVHLRDGRHADGEWQAPGRPRPGAHLRREGSGHHRHDRREDHHRRGHRRLTRVCHTLGEAGSSSPGKR